MFAAEWCFCSSMSPVLFLVAEYFWGRLTEFMHRCKCHLMHKQENGEKVGFLVSISISWVFVLIPPGRWVIMMVSVRDRWYPPIWMRQWMNVAIYDVAILSPLYMMLVWVSPITFRSTKEGFKVTRANKWLIPAGFRSGETWVGHVTDSSPYILFSCSL